MSTVQSTDPATLLRQQESLREIIESISSELELRPLLTLIVRRACDLLGADNGTIGLVDEQRRVVRTEAAYKMPDGEIGSEFLAGVGLFGHIFQHGQSVILGRYGDVHQPTQLTYLENAIIGVPILWRNQIIGAFGLGSPPPRQFTDQDVEVLSLFARHAAIAIINAKLFESQRQRTQRSAIINQIGQQISSSLDIHLILETAVQSLNAYFDGANVALLLLDPEDQETMVLRARSGVDHLTAPSEYRQSIHVGIIGEAARTRQTLLVADARNDPRYVIVPGVDKTQMELAIPLVIGERLLGVLNIESAQPLPSDSVTDLESIADQLSIAINNAQHYAEEKRRAQRLELIARVGQRIAVRLDPEEFFTTTIQELYTQLGYEHVSFFVLDETDPTWLEQRAFASRWADAGRIGYRQSTEQGILGLAARQRIPILINDVNTDPHFIAVSETATMRAELAVPILSGGRLLGVFDVGSSKPFLEDDVKAIQIITDQFAVAIEHTYLLAATQRALRETELLYQTSQRLSVALGVDEVVKTYLEEVAARNRYACTIALYGLNEQGQRYTVEVHGQWTPSEGLRAPLAIRLPYTPDGLDSPLDVGSTVAISNVHLDPRVSDELRRIQQADRRPALAMIPLMVRGERIGLVILSYPMVHDWQLAHLHPYQITAAQLAAAIDSRRQQARFAQRNQQWAVLEERRRLARELHDSVTQLLFSITLIAQSVGSAWRRNPTDGEQRIQRLLELSQSALAEMRALLVELRPSDPSEQMSPPTPPSMRQVQEHGLAYALRAHTATLRHEGLTINLAIDEQLQPTGEQAEMLFRIAQESLNNVVKHARASRVQIKLAREDGKVAMTVSDNGIGFTHSPDRLTKNSAQENGQPGGMGLETMQERAAALGATFEVISAPGQGTMIRLLLA
jgi:GAF domain-containing protein/anti-sigma regulatory factor (Ser/Thr protein kinase)